MPTQSTPTTSHFLVLFRDSGPGTHQNLSPEERAGLTRQWNDWVDGLLVSGKMQHGQPLGFNGRVVSGPRGERVTDGPYAEAKEVVAGYLLLNVPDLDAATAIARQCPSLPLGMTVEVRPILDRSPALEGVCGKPPAEAVKR